MGKIWKIGGREIALAAELPSGAMPLENYRIPAAGLLSSDPMVRRESLDLFRAVGGILAVNADLKMRDVQAKVFDRLNLAFTRKEIIAFNREAKSGVSTDRAGSSSQQSNNAGNSGSSSSSSGPPPDLNKTSDKTWVDIQLLDENGDPVGGERYILKLTDGSTREGTLGDDGRVRVNGIDPGTCIVTFPDIHTKEWWRKS